MDARERQRRVRQRTLLLQRVASVEEFVRGSVVLMKRRCGRPGCGRCAKGEGHPTWVLTYSERGKTHTVYLGGGRLDEARRLVGNYRRVTAWLEQAAQINLALLQGRTGNKEADHDEARSRA